MTFPRKNHLLATIAILLVAASNVFAQAPATRDPWLWPFASDSIWNTPIGSGAQYVPANLGVLSYVNPDPEFFVRLTSADPSVTVYFPGGPYRADGTTVSWLGSMQVPYDFIVPDVDLDPGHYSTPNDCATFLQTDNESLFQIAPTARIAAGGPIWGFPQIGENAGGGLHQDGMYGVHYGSGLSAIGGSIRRGEMSSVNPIRHAIKIELTWANLYRNPNDSTNDYGTYRWPAKNSDNNADGLQNPAEHYSGTNPALTEGSLLALLPNATEKSLGLTTAAGKKLFHAFQDYGAYQAETTDVTGNWINIPVEDGVQNTEITTWTGAFYNDVAAIYANLYIVNNNSPTSIGGGGTPRAPQPLPIAPSPTPAAGAMYRLIGKLSTTDNQLCLKISEGREARERNAKVGTCNGHRPQNWILQDTGNGYFELMNQASGLCLEERGERTAPGSNVGEGNCVNRDTQQWMPAFVAGGYFTFTNQHSGLLLDDTYSGTKPGNDVSLNRANGASEQSWLLEQQ